ncbi:unnamed protein product [Lactuca virosa]|uniref:Uncharacterized protein n=1 Tax=Lactuca virosa TaxID=75947 RepID=A0AAU9N1Y6_9ASTR|nr:unnamed protein product [Lactuca virosa]
MENLINLLNKLQKACTALGDFGEESSLPTLWDALPTIVVVGGQELSLGVLLFYYFIRSKKEKNRQSLLTFHESRSLILLPGILSLSMKFLPTVTNLLRKLVEEGQKPVATQPQVLGSFQGVVSSSGSSGVTMENGNGTEMESRAMLQAFTCHPRQVDSRP